MITVDHEAIIKCDPETVIWRYIDLPKFEGLLHDQGLFLCRSDKFSDPYEASIPKREADYRIKEHMKVAASFGRQTTLEKAMENSNSIGNLHKRFRRGFVVNCWHMSTTESDAMWRLYLKTNEGVAIQSSYKRLYDSLKHNEEEIFISRVRYLDYEKDIWHHKEFYPVTKYNLFTPIVHKRLAFIHENELRVFQQLNEAVDNPTYWQSQANQFGKTISCDINILIDKVILPPTAEDDVLKKVEDLMTKYDCKAQIIKSKLNDPPIY